MLLGCLWLSFFFIVGDWQTSQKCFLNPRTCAQHIGFVVAFQVHAERVQRAGHVGSQIPSQWVRTSRYGPATPNEFNAVISHLPTPPAQQLLFAMIVVIRPWAACAPTNTSGRITCYPLKHDVLSWGKITGVKSPRVSLSSLQTPSAARRPFPRATCTGCTSCGSACPRNRGLARS